jgi:hypothetical protein
VGFAQPDPTGGRDAARIKIAIIKKNASEMRSIAMAHAIFK